MLAPVGRTDTLTGAVHRVRSVGRLASRILPTSLIASATAARHLLLGRLWLEKGWEVNGILAEVSLSGQQAAAESRTGDDVAPGTGENVPDSW
jgi:hypothetical protein